MKKAVFLDRDGTINIDTGYVGDPDKLVIIEGAREAIKLLKDKGFLVFIVTNQSGVARGYFSVEQMQLVNKKILDELAHKQVCIDGIYYCPHHPDEECSCRKPKPLIVNSIAAEFAVELKRSYFVGDKMSDVHTGKNAGCRTVLINSDDEVGSIEPDFVAKDLLEGSQWIVKDSDKS